MVVPLCDRWVAAVAGAVLVITAWTNVIGTLDRAPPGEQRADTVDGLDREPGVLGVS